MSISKSFLKRVLFVFFLGGFGLQYPVQSAVEKDPLHWSGDKTLWSRKNNKVELFGNAAVHKVGESLKADYILLDLTNRTVDAKGNCVYVASDTVIHAEEIHFSLDTSAGTIVGGRVSNGQFSLVGERINKLGVNRYQTHRAEYTTCHDCPSSWSFRGDDVELEFDGYAYMHNVTTEIKDTPILWLPYMIVPLKTRRQTGFLFPKFGSSNDDGFKFVLPFFWATGRSTDMTFSAGMYTAKGKRFEWEGRYALSGRSKAQANFFYTDDKASDAPQSRRWALEVEQTQELPLNIDEKLRIVDASDNEYPSDFRDDIPGYLDPVLTSDLILSHSSPNLSAYIAAKRYRNLLEFDQPTKFDHKTVQLAPKFEMTSNDQFIGSTPIAAGLTLGLSNFTRAEAAFDYDCEATDSTCDTTGVAFQPGVDPIRKATRFSMFPKVYTTLRPFDVVSVVPSAQYRGFYYHFNEELDSLSRGYLLFQVDLSLQFEKIYDTYNPDRPRVKHLFRPTIRYSRIPYVFEPDHPFLDQIERENGYNFDTNDIVPISTSPSLTNYFTPLGHSLSYGFTTQLIERRGQVSDPFSTYRRTVELTAGQTVNFLEFDKFSGERVPFSRLFATAELSFDKLTSTTQYYFYPHLDVLLPDEPETRKSPHWINTSFKYTIDSGTRQEVLYFERSFGLSYYWRRLGSRDSIIGGNFVYSLSDYIMPSATAQYDLEEHTFREVIGKIDFQSPSRCWKFDVSLGWSLDRQIYWTTNFSLNLTGTGFDGVSEIVPTGE